MTTVKPDLFIITSVINTGNNPWSYTSTRSVYSPQERFEQTLQTIQSIRDYAKGSKILFVECSDLSPAMTHELASRVDIFEQLYHNDSVRSVCLQTTKKGYGEAIQTLEAIRIIKEFGIEFQRMFKISGRYWLKPDFSLDIFSDEVYTFKQPQGASYSTVLYSVPKSLFGDYERIILECCNIYKYSTEAFGWELLFPPKCHPKRLVSYLKVAGKVAIATNDLYEG